MSGSARGSLSCAEEQTRPTRPTRRSARTGSDRPWPSRGTGGGVTTNPKGARKRPNRQLADDSADFEGLRRTRDQYDRRRKRIWLTDEGGRRIDVAYEQLVASGWVQLALDCTLGTHGRPDGICRGPCFKGIYELDWHLQSLRRGFSDSGCLEYP